MLLLLMLGTVGLEVHLLSIYRSKGDQNEQLQSNSLPACLAACRFKSGRVSRRLAVGNRHTTPHTILYIYIQYIIYYDGGILWFGVVWLVRFGLGWFRGLVWCGFRFVGLVGMVWYGMVSCGSLKIPVDSCGFLWIPMDSYAYDLHGAAVDACLLGCMQVGWLCGVRLRVHAVGECTTPYMVNHTQIIPNHTTTTTQPHRTKLTNHTKPNHTKSTYQSTPTTPTNPHHTTPPYLHNIKYT